MTADRCPESGACEWRLSCGAGGPEESEMIPGADARTKYSVAINKGLAIRTFPITIHCTAWEDDGWFGTTWEKVGSASVEAPAGGDYKLTIANREQGTVSIRMAVDSLEIGPAAMPGTAAAAASAARPAAGKKAAAPAKATAPRTLVGAFIPQKNGHAVVIGLEEKAFKAKVDELSGLGLQIDDIETWEQGGKRLWSGIFRNSPDQVQLITGQDWDKFSTSWKKLTGGKMRLTDMEVYPGGGQNLFAGVFRDLGESHSLWVGQTRKDFADKVKELAGFKGQRLLDFEPYGSGTATLYAGTFRVDTLATDLWTGLKLADFQSRVNGLRGKNTQIIDIETYKDGKDRIFEAVTRTGPAGDVVMGVDLNTFAKRWLEMIGKGERLVSLESYQE
jgi:hypothetical protein